MSLAHSNGSSAVTNPPGAATVAAAGSISASAFHPCLQGKRAAGSLLLDASGVHFGAAVGGLKIDLPLRGLQMRLGGNNDRLIFFSHPDQPDVTVYTPDHSVLRDPHLVHDRQLSAQLSAVRGKKHLGRLIGLSILAMLLGSLVALWLLKEPLVGLVAGLVPAEAEVALGDVVFGQVEATMRVIDDPNLQAEVDELVAPLLAVVPDTGYQFDFHVVDNPELNAFAIPGGHVVLHSGLLLEAETPEQVLGVLGHELAHVTERHSLRQMVSAAGLFVVVQMLLGDVSGIVAVVADGGLQLLTLGFSRDFEREADEVGWEYLTVAGIDPRGLTQFFEKLQAQQQEMLGEEGAEVQEALGFLSTHPATEERISKLRERWHPDLATTPIPPDRLTVIQDRLHQLLGGSEVSIQGGSE